MKEVFSGTCSFCDDNCTLCERCDFVTHHGISHAVIKDFVYSVKFTGYCCKQCSDELSCTTIRRDW